MSITRLRQRGRVGAEVARWDGLLADDPRGDRLMRVCTYHAFSEDKIDKRSMVGLIHRFNVVSSQRLG